MEFIFGLKLAKKKYDVFSYNSSSSSSSWILILIPVLIHNNTIHSCVSVFLCLISNFIWKLWKKFFCLLNLETKICFFDMVFWKPKCWYTFLDTFDSVKCNIYLCLKECFANEQFFLMEGKSEWSWIEGMMKNLNFSQYKCVQYTFNIILLKCLIVNLLCKQTKNINIHNRNGNRICGQNFFLLFFYMAFLRVIQNFIRIFL